MIGYRFLKHFRLLVQYSRQNSIIKLINRLDKPQKRKWWDICDVHYFLLGYIEEEFENSDLYSAINLF